MSVISVSSKYLRPSKGSNKASGRSCIDYLTDDKPHVTDDIVKVRNLAVTSTCGDFKQALKANEEQLKDKNGDNTVNLYSLVQSFSNDELDYQDPRALELAHTIGVNTARKILKSKGINRDFAVYTQADGQSHHLHNHILIMNYKDGHAIEHGLSWLSTLQPVNDAVTQEYLGAKAVATPLERTHHHHSNTKENKQHIADAVKDALTKATSIADFERLIASQNVRIRYRSGRDESKFDGFGNAVDADEAAILRWSNKSGGFSKSLTFEYNGTKARSKRLLGLETEQIYKQLQRNRQRQLQRQRAVQAERKAEQKPKSEPKTTTSEQKKSRLQPTHKTGKPEVKVHKPEPRVKGDEILTNQRAVVSVPRTLPGLQGRAEKLDVRALNLFTYALQTHNNDYKLKAEALGREANELRMKDIQQHTEQSRQRLLQQQEGPSL